MTVAERIRMNILIEKMNQHKEYSERLGLENISRLRGEKIKKKGEERC